VGLILDSSVVIAGERQGRTVRQILGEFRTAYGDTGIGLSVVTVAELAHGIQGAGNEIAGNAGRRLSMNFIRDVPVHPVTVDTARVAGRIEGDQAARGITIARADLLIAATAL